MADSTEMAILRVLAGIVGSIILGMMFGSIWVTLVGWFIIILIRASQLEKQGKKQ